MVKLGNKVKDRVSGYKGIAVAEPQLKVMKKGHVVRMASFTDPGGPEKYLDEGR